MTTHAIERLDGRETTRVLRAPPDAAHPVVFRGLFAGHPVAALDSVGAARRLLGATPVRVFDNYAAISGALAGTGWRPRPPETVPLASYLDEPGDPMRVVSEQPAPPELRALFAVPAEALPSDRPPGDLRTKLFVGRAGSFATLHFDADQRCVLLHQCFGRKRFVLIDPAATKFLCPRANSSMVFVQNLSEEEKARFFAFTGAWETVLEPGETLFIPALWWHYAEYRDLQLSFNLRLARNRYGRFLGDRVLPSWSLQAFSRLLLREAAVDDDLETAFEELRRTVTAPHADLDTKHQAVSSLLAALCARFVPHLVVPRYVHHAYDRWERLNAREFYGARGPGADGEAVEPDDPARGAPTP